MRVKGGDIVLIIVAILFPPLAVFLMTGCSCDLIINILLTILGFIPGHLHAFWLIYKKLKAEEVYGPGGYKYTGSGVYAPVYATGPATTTTAAPQTDTYGTTGATIPPPVVDNKKAF